MENNLDIGVVIVTYKREDKLNIALNAYENQTCKPKYVLVVNNHSNDETENILNRWEKHHSKYMKYVLNLPKNIGGSGGFYEGLKKARELDAEWIWIADDDAYPFVDAIEKAKSHIKNKNIIHKDIGVICATVIKNGEIDCGHRRRFLGLDRFYLPFEKPIHVNEYSNSFFYLDIFSYVGVILKRETVRSIGLPKKEYFIYYDDIEHSIRIAKKKTIICFSDIKVIHDNIEEQKKGFSWKDYYGLRNRMDVYKNYFPEKYTFFYYKTLIKTYVKLLIGRKEAKVLLDAIDNGRKGNLGIHPLYKPGWKL